MASLILVRQPHCVWCGEAGCKANTLHLVSTKVGPFDMPYWDNRDRHMSATQYWRDYKIVYRWPK